MMLLVLLIMENEVICAKLQKVSISKSKESHFQTFLTTFLNFIFSVKITTTIPPKTSGSPNPSNTTKPVTTQSTTSPTTSKSTSKTTSTASSTSTTAFQEDDSSGMSAGAIAIVVIVCLVATAGGVVFLLVYVKKDIRLRKLLRLEGSSNGSRQPQSFENLGYDSSSPQNLN